MAPLACLILLLGGSVRPCLGQQDAYEKYVKTSKAFQRVKQDKARCLKACPSWTYMPWSYQWTIGYDDAAGEFCKEHGYNGAFLDWGRTRARDGTDKLAWINKFKLRFYMDHTAAKRYLHLWDGGQVKSHLGQVHGAGVRVKPVNTEMKKTLKGYIRKHIGNVISSPQRAAYALDDEISWGHFVHPTMWQVTDHPTAYRDWLNEIYGGSPPVHPGWITYDNIRGNLPVWTVGTFNASQLMDQWTFNDSWWLNFVGDLVEYANTIDPRTPCGFVGGQSPNAFGGYDYAKIMKKVQYIESYDLGRSNSIIRSLNPRNAIPSVTTHFYGGVDETVWMTWYYLAHGNRGHIGWVQNWFDGTTPKPWHDQVAPTYLEAGNNVGPLMAEAEWVQDGVAILYNHASIQMSWILDAQAHGSTWVNRNGDNRLGSSHLVRRAWENMLRDEGIQYNYIAYDDLIRDGVPSEYKVLILPAAICLSEAEARGIREFCAAGGTVIADYMPGLWDQHGKGRPDGGALDDVFGLAHDPNLRSGNIFQTTLWCEVNQDKNYYYSNHETFLTNANTCIMDPSGFYKAVLNMPTINVSRYGDGKAVLMNLSPQWYNAYRCISANEAADHRSVFMEAIHDTGITRWVQIEGAGPAEHGYEIAYWTKDGRTLLFLCLNPEDLVSSTVVGLRSSTIPITLKFYDTVVNLRDERTGQALGDGYSFNFVWKMNEALVLSFQGPPPSVHLGDANFDGQVDGGDYTTWADHYLQDGGWLAGDFNGDHFVDGGDYTDWADNYGLGVAGAAPTPEPTGLLILLAGACLALRRNRRR